MIFFIKKKIRIVILKFLRIIISFFIEKKNSKLSDEIIVLGRGISLNSYYKNFYKLKNVKDVLIINFEKRDFGKNLNSLINKNVVPVVNLDEVIISIYQIIKLSITSSFIARLESQKTETELKRQSYKSILYGELRYFEDYQFIDPDLLNRGAGFLTVVYLTLVLKVKNIYIFGFDFYQMGMHNISLLENFGSKSNMIAHQDHGKENLIKFQNFIIQNPQTNFYLPKETNIRVNAKNFFTLDY